MCNGEAIFPAEVETKFEVKVLNLFQKNTGGLEEETLTGVYEVVSWCFLIR